ncbi:hypothetical protein SEA_ENYGMA_25 [Streptomyces phage Enygma]
MNEPGAEETDVFDKDAYEVVNTIMLLRLYDIMMCVARGVNPDEAVKLLALHKAGKIAGPPPSWDMTDNDSQD